MARRESLQYGINKRILDGLQNDVTIKQYKRSVRNFCKWFQASKIERCILDEQPAKVIQQYADHLTEAYGSSNTIHSYLAPICKGFDIDMADINKPIRRAADCKKGRVDAMNVQGKRELASGRYDRLIAFQRVVGLRRSELARLTVDDVIMTPDGMYVHVCRGKGGKEQYQRVLPQDVNTVKQVIDSATTYKLFTATEMNNKIDLHSIRATCAQQAYMYYLGELKHQDKRQEYIHQLTQYFAAMNKHDSRYNTHYRRFCDDIQKNNYQYVLRGDVAQIAKNRELPTEYDRVALMMVSVFHLSHWRNDVTVKNYMVR